MQEPFVRFIADHRLVIPEGAVDIAVLDDVDRTFIGSCSVSPFGGFVLLCTQDDPSVSSHMIVIGWGIKRADYTLKKAARSLRAKFGIQVLAAQLSQTIPKLF